MFHVILFQPEIPPNTGNIIRLCANSGCQLHLIEPLGFELDDKRLRRAGLDYHEYATLKRHPDLASCLASLGQPRVFAFTTKGSQAFHEVSYQPRVCKNTFLSCVLQSIAPGRGDFPIIYHDQRR